MTPWNQKGPRGAGYRSLFRPFPQSPGPCPPDTPRSPAAFLTPTAGACSPLLSWSLPLSKQSRAGHRGPRSGPLLTALSSSHPLGLGPRRALGSRRAQGPRRPRDEGRGQQSPPPRDSHASARVGALLPSPPLPAGHRLGTAGSPRPPQSRGGAEQQRLHVCVSVPQNRR